MKLSIPSLAKKLPAILAFLIVTVPLTALIAHASISGDEVCGATAQTECQFSNLGTILKNVLTLVIALGLPCMVVFISYRFVKAWFVLQQGNANAYKEALKQAMNSVFAFLFIVIIFGSFITLLGYLGVKSDLLKIFGKDGLKIFSDVLVTHAYAADASSTAGTADKLLPNFFISDSLYDFLMKIFSFVMRFFIYPALVVMWVWTGFAFVFAQGAPDALKKAKQWLVWAFVTTLVIFMVQMFLTAITGTIEKVLPGSTSVIKNTASTNTGVQTTSGTAPSNVTNNNTNTANTSATCKTTSDCQSGYICNGTPATCQRDVGAAATTNGTVTTTNTSSGDGSSNSSALSEYIRQCKAQDPNKTGTQCWQEYSAKNPGQSTTETTSVSSGESTP